MRLTLALVLLAAATACGGSSEGTMEGQESEWETYTSAIDGVVVTHPTTWHRAEAPLAAALVGHQVEVLGLATGELPEAERGCSPYPWAAMRALRAGDLVLTLHVWEKIGADDEWADYGRGRLGSKPDDLLGQQPLPPAELSGGCAVNGVELRQVDFLAHERRYTAFLAYRGNLSEERRDELRTVWSSLTLRPVPTADESAAIGERYWHMLFTHCGIVGTRFADRDWVAEPVLDDGNRNPPTGWGNPWQPGVMTLRSQDHAEFESRNGELQAAFRPRTPTDPPAQPCD
jgi:hypothetical protein